MPELKNLVAVGGLSGDVVVNSTHLGAVFVNSGTAAAVVQIPPHGAGGLPVGFYFSALQLGAGVITVTTVGGASIEIAAGEGPKTAGPNTRIDVLQTDFGSWSLQGGLGVIDVPVLAASPAITGTAQVEQTLTASHGGWTNTPTSYAYQWKGNGTPIGGATASTFILTEAQIGQVVTVAVTATNAGGASAPATSAGTAAVIAEPAPVNSVLPLISGTAQSGQTLSTTNGTWSHTPTAYTYQWKAGGTPIGGATAATFDLTDTQIGALITVTVTATNAGGSTAATSLPTAAVIAA